MMNSIIALVLGVCIGSFLNVCSYRIPRGESLVYPGSYCPQCGHSLNALDLMPIVSYIFLRGKCGYCKEKISPRYLCAELLTGIFFVLLYNHFGFTLEFLLYALFISLLIVLTIIDIDYMILPTPIIFFGTCMGIIVRALQAARYESVVFLWNPILGALIGFGIFYALFYLGRHFLKKECLGFGDIRLMGMIGLYVSLDLIFLTIFLASLLGAIYGGLSLWKNKKSEAFPFAPFINGAALIASFYGYSILEWYLKTMNMTV